MIKAVIFDLDGVIAETEHLHIEAEKETLLKYGVTISSDELHRYTGTTAKAMFNDLIKRYGLNTMQEKLSREKETILFELLGKELQPTKGVIELVKKLKQNKIELAIASSSNKKLVQHVLEKLQLVSFFDTVFTSEDITQGKPDPEIFLKTANNLGMDPSACLVVEDSKFGVEAAKSAGMKCLGYRNPNSGNQDLSKADFLVDDFAELDISGVRGRLNLEFLTQDHKHEKC